MAWDEAAIRRYEEWYNTPTGAFAFMRERRLIERLIADWPRRDQKLVEIGCGTGKFLETFWESGFDVAGIDASQAMIRSARERLGDRVALDVGHAECLPYDENEFDFAAMLTILEFMDDPVRVIQEAARVARKGLVVSFLNRNSLYYLSNGIRLPFFKKSTMRTAKWYSPGQMRRLLTLVLGPRPLEFRSTLPGPKWSWSAHLPWKWLNGPLCPGTCGAYCAVKVDLTGGKPLTPIYAYEPNRESM